MTTRWIWPEYLRQNPAVKTNFEDYLQYREISVNNDLLKAVRAEQHQAAVQLVGRIDEIKDIRRQLKLMEKEEQAYADFQAKQK